MEEKDSKESLSPEELSRREFCKSCGKLSVALAAFTFIPGLSAFASKDTPFFADFSDSFEDSYRKKWTWDEVHLGTHNINCWYQQNCLFHVYKKDGKIIREEQVGNYPQTNENVPDFNPRGCQKGCAYSEFMYSKPRITKPLKRDGERGEGKWKEVTWDEAATDIAGKLLDTIQEHGSKTVVVDPGTNIVNYLTFYSMFRFFDYLDSTILDINTELGDDQQGAAITYGEISNDRSADDYFYSDLIFIWGGNPAFTQIPNFHFLTEARYNGTKIVNISPDLNASAIHADYFIPVKPGTDSALANAMAYIMINEKLYDKELIREQTDLPCLVRTDNGKLLRKSDFKGGGGEEILYRWDTKLNRLKAINNVISLRMGEVVPALEGEYKVKIRGNKEVTVKPVLEFIKEQLKEFSPEKASKICGIAPETIRMLTNMLIESKAATNTCTSSFSKFYHGDILVRSQILAFVLAGHLGKKGSGYVTASFLVPDGSVNMVNDLESVKDIAVKFAFKYGVSFWKDVITRADWRRSIYEYGLDTFVDSRMMANSTLFWNLHGGLLKNSGRTNEWDPYLKRDIKEYIDETLEKEWQVLDPELTKDPKVMFSWAGNSLRRVRSSNILLDELWPKLDLIVALEMRLSSTAMFADYVLPVSGAYEKSTTMVANTTPLAPFLHATNKAVKNVGQSKDEWEIACLLAKKIQEVAKERKIRSFKTSRKKSRAINKIYSVLTSEFKDLDSEKISEKMVNESTNLDGKWNDIKDKGYVKLTGIGNHPANFGNAFDDVKPGETISPHTWHTEKKDPWITLSGRIQFYIDHDWYLELREQMPIHKDPPKAGGDYPLVITGGHARWSIHAQWRTDPLLLRLQRGGPFLMVSQKDAIARSLEDDDKVKIHNDVGEFLSHIKISASVQPGQVIMYHGWENYQYENWVGYRTVLASPLNPIEMVGDYPYMNPVMAVKQPGQSDRDTRVNIIKA
jgi:steroid C-25 hydroxylase alpha subunit